MPTTQSHTTEFLLCHIYHKFSFMSVPSFFLLFVTPFTCVITSIFCVVTPRKLLNFDEKIIIFKTNNTNESKNFPNTHASGKEFRKFRT